MAETSEGAQELLPRGTTGAGEQRREVGAVLRLPEGGYVDPGDIDIERRDDQTMIINMGPQHPSTHGVLRLMLELDGETVLRTKPIIGYLHTGMEKTGEELTYVQGATNTTRMDYLSPLHNELVFSLATEALLGVEMPPRATWIRMLMCELNRVSSHLLWMATNGMDLGSTSMMIYGFREREMVLAFFEKTTGAAHEPQLHPPGRRGGRPARRVAGRHRRHLRDDPRPHLRVRRASHRPAHLPRAHRGGRQHLGRGSARPLGDRAHPALHRRAVGPAPHHAVPGLRQARLRRDRRELRRQLRPLFGAAQRDPGVDPHDPPDRRDDAAGRLPGAGPQGHTASPRPDRREHGGAHPPLQDLHRGLPGARGRGLRGDRVPPRRARLLHGLRRHIEALPHAHPGPELRQPAVAAAPAARRPDGRRGRQSSPRSTRSWAKWTGEPPQRGDAPTRPRISSCSTPSGVPRSSLCAIWRRSRTGGCARRPSPRSASSAASPRPR